MKKIINFCLYFFVGISIGYSQEFCQTNVNQQNALELETFFKNNPSKNYNGQRPMVRLALHNIVNFSGVGSNSWEDIRNVVNGLPAYFEQHNICFTVVSEDEISSNSFFYLSDFWDFNFTWQDMVKTNVVNNAINIYIVAAANSGGKATGFLSNNCLSFHDIDYPTVSLSNTLGNTNTFNSQVLAHEIGHCLGLYHTHQEGFTCFNNTISCLEEIPRNGNLANCNDCGDFLCDTPADPGLDFSTDKVNSSTCEYIGGETLNGFDYQPDTRNVMSYTLPECMQWFTKGQGIRMRNFILNTPFFDDYVIPVDINISEDVIGDKYYGTESSISSTAIHTEGQHVYEAGNEINLDPGFSISATSINTFDARIELYSCVEPLVENSGKRIFNEIVEADEGNNFNVFPNPTKDGVSLSFNDLLAGELRVSILDLTGKETLLYDGYIGTGDKAVLSFDLSNFSTGIYFIRLSGSNVYEVKKLVIE